MSMQRTDIERTAQQNNILDLEQKYMRIIEEMVTSKSFLEDLKHIESETQEYYELLKEVWGKKNKVKEVSERLLRHHIYLKFRGAERFYSSPISCDIALELDDIILNLDVKTIDKIGNGGELNTTQFEHNQTSFINEKVLSSGAFPGFVVKSNLQSIDPRTHKPILTFLVKIGYSDDNHGTFNFINSTTYPSIVVTCLPNGALSNLFDNNLFSNFKDYTYYTNVDGNYFKWRYITAKDEFNVLTETAKFNRIQSQTDIPEEWEKVIWGNKVGYYDSEKKVVWWTADKKTGNHWDIYLQPVKNGNTARFNDSWLEERFNSKNEAWIGESKYYKLYDKLNEESN